MSGVRKSRRAGVPAMRIGMLVTALTAAGCDNPASSKPDDGLVLRTRMPAALEAVGPKVAAQVVPFDRVRLILTRLTGARAADVTFPVDPVQDPIQVSLDVSLGLSVPLLGELFTLIVECIDGTGAAVYRGGPVPVLVKPGTATPPVDIQLAYVGGGSVATVLQIVPNALSVLLGQAFSFTATAFDAQGNPVDAPIVWSVLDPVLATLTSPLGGLGSALGLGTARIVAAVPDGPADTALLTISPLAAATRLLELVSGGGQSGLLGALLGNPVVVRVVDEASQPLSGIPVTFSATNGGILGTPNALSGTNGLAQTTWTLGSLLGTQTLTATAEGLTGNPLSVPATGLALPVVVATALELTTSVASSVAGNVLSDVVVRAVDDAGNLVPSYANQIALALGQNPGGATLLGTRTVTPTNGVATFDDLSLQKAASGYTLIATASGLSSATSNSFSVTNAAASILSIAGGDNQSALLGVLLGNPLSVRVTDAFANPVASFPVGWAISLGGGLLGSPTTQTNASGVATNTWTLGLLAGLQRVTATANGLSGSPALFSATGLLGLPLGLQLVSGGGQSGLIGSLLGEPVVVRVVDDAARPVAGVPVSFTATNGGLLGTPSVVSSGTGVVQTTWTLGSLLGTQTLSATAQGATQTLTVPATGLPIVQAVATALEMTTTVASTIAGAVLSTSFIVRAVDAAGNVVTNYVNPITVALGQNPAGATLFGTRTVTPANGVARFDDLSIQKAASGYSLVATASGLAGATSNAFSITNAAAALMGMVSGNNQSALVGALLGNPLRVLVTDQYANPVAGVPVVWGVAQGGGALGNSTTQTNASGIAANTWTLGSLVGLQRATGSVTGLSGSPSVFEATGLPLPQPVATALQMTTSMSSGVAGAGLTALVVRAVDDAGNVVTGYSNPISVALGQNPGGATLLGTRTVTPTNGVATFDDLSLQRAASGYTLVATASGLSSTTSNAFSVTSAAASILSIVSGNNQSAVLGALLGSPLSVRVTDAFANPVAGVPVAWAVSLGGGLLGNSTSQTNASGIATNTWTLGLLAGLQRATASVTGLSGSPAVFDATGLLSLPLSRARGGRAP